MENPSGLWLQSMAGESEAVVMVCTEFISYFRKVSVLNWHDCALPGKNIENPDDCKPFSTSQAPLRKKALVRLFNKAITKIHKDGYDMSVVYTDSLKLAAKRYGPNSDEVMQELANLDEVLQVILKTWDKIWYRM